jgi:hypothetical protein
MEDKVFAFGMGAVVVLMVLVLFAAIGEHKRHEAFNKACEAKGGKTLKYSAYRKSTRLTCVKADAVIEL